MYQSNFFYSDGLKNVSAIPRVLSVWKVYSDGLYRREISEAEKEYYPRNTYSFVHTLSGDGVINTENGAIQLSCGDFLLLNLSDILSYRASGNVWEYLWINLLSDTKYDIDKIINYPVTDYERGLINELLYVGSSLDARYGYIDSIFAHYAARIRALRPDMQIKHKSWVRTEEIESYIQQKYMTNITVRQVAEFFHLSVRRINQIFRNADGLSPKEYILRAKIDRAKSLLATSSAQVAEIANMLSFSSPFHFSKTFKQLTGVSPTEYRKISADERD